MDFSSLFQPAIITSAGGIVLAIILAWTYFKTVGNHMNHNTDAVSELAKNTAVNTEVLNGVRDSQIQMANSQTKMAEALTGLTAVIKDHK